MRSLTLKLTLAFLFVGLIGALLVALIVVQRTQHEFDKFVLNRYQEDMIANLADVYEERGGWNEVEAIVLQRPGNPRGRDFVRAPVTLIDENDIVIYSRGHYRLGQRVSGLDQASAVPIEVEGKTVGRIIFESRGFPFASPRETPETAFIRSVNLAIFFGAIGATLIALLVGILLARSISRPVKQLTAATQAVAHGELGRQVKVTNKDEIGDLAASFNQMSSDLRRGTELRRQMTADIAHDLRTPLSVILGYTEALADGKLEGTPAMYEIMHDESLHLQHLIDDLRTLSLADSGELSLSRQYCMPKTLLERTAAAHATKAHNKHIHLSVQADDDLPEVEVDPDRMAQVLNNLVSNAVRFTPEGGEITLSARHDEENVYLLVQDNGEGIDKDVLPNIFERFYRGDEVRDIEEGESGLGLAIAKSLTEAQGGSISADSREGEGTVFTIALHAQPA